MLFWTMKCQNIQLKQIQVSCPSKKSKKKKDLIFLLSRPQIHVPTNSPTLSSLEPYFYWQTRSIITLEAIVKFWMQFLKLEVYFLFSWFYSSGLITMHFINFKWFSLEKCIATWKQNNMASPSLLLLLFIKYWTFWEFSWNHGRKQRNLKKNIVKLANFWIFFFFIKDFSLCKEHFQLFSRIINFKLFISWGTKLLIKPVKICRDIRWNSI